MRNLEERTEKVENAFKRDNYTVIRKEIHKDSNSLGILARHNTAVNSDTGEAKKAYYLEGTAYGMGYVMGRLAEEDVYRMWDYAKKFVPEFLDAKILEKIPFAEDLILDFLYDHIEKNYDKLPMFVKNEIEGLIDGCIWEREVRGRPKVSEKEYKKHIVTVNLGIDAVCGLIYSHRMLKNVLKSDEIKPEHFNIAVMCNAFSVHGSLTDGSHYFGRDFMFPTIDIFQDTAAMIIYNPVKEGTEDVYPFVNMACPGMVGSIAAMNSQNVGIGVDMCGASNSNPNQFGIDSIMLNRCVIQHSKSAQEAVEKITTTPRSVSWSYAVADGKNNRSCVVEAGLTKSKPEFLENVASEIKELIKKEIKHDIEKEQSAPYKNGAMVRWDDYTCPQEFLTLNKKMWDIFNKHIKPWSRKKVPYTDEYFGTRSYIDKSFKGKNCPEAVYFSPQREDLKELMILTNHYITPEMRFYSMEWWVMSIMEMMDLHDDSQWRYDELNNRILSIVDMKRKIDFETARKLIDYLNPYGDIRDYYSDNPLGRIHSDKKKNWDMIRIEGCTSLFDLSRLEVESHYGYFKDEWVKISLANYL